MSKLQVIIGLGAAILLGILVAQNRALVETRLLFATVTMPLAFLLFIVAVASFTLGVLLTLQKAAKRSGKR